MAFGNQFTNSFLHFPRSLICKSHSKNALRRNAPLDHVRNAIGDDARLASARAR
jgi:hypothetical protein